MALKTLQDAPPKAYVFYGEFGAPPYYKQHSSDQRIRLYWANEELSCYKYKTWENYQHKEMEEFEFLKSLPMNKSAMADFIFALSRNYYRGDPYFANTFFEHDKEVNDAIEYPRELNSAIGSPQGLISINSKSLTFRSRGEKAKAIAGPDQKHYEILRCEIFSCLLGEIAQKIEQGVPVYDESALDRACMGATDLLEYSQIRHYASRVSKWPLLDNGETLHFIPERADTYNNKTYSLSSKGVYEAVGLAVAEGAKGVAITHTGNAYEDISPTVKKVSKNFGIEILDLNEISEQINLAQEAFEHD